MTAHVSGVPERIGLEEAQERGCFDVPGVPGHGRRSKAMTDWHEKLWQLIATWGDAKRALDGRRTRGEQMNADYHDAIEAAERAIDAHVSGVMGDCGNAACGWRGPLSDCSRVGSVGPCCPQCREIVEPDASGMKGGA